MLTLHLKCTEETYRSCRWHITKGCLESSILKHHGIWPGSLVNEISKPHKTKSSYAEACFDRYAPLLQLDSIAHKIRCRHISIKLNERSLGAASLSTYSPVSKYSDSPSNVRCAWRQIRGKCTWRCCEQVEPSSDASLRSHVLPRCTVSLRSGTSQSLQHGIL